MGVSVHPHKFSVSLEHFLLTFLIQEGGVGVVPFVGNKLVGGIFRIGIPCGQKHITWGGISQDPGVAPVFPVGLRGYGEEHHRHPATLVVISEIACVEAISASIPMVAEPGPVGDHSAAGDHAGEIADCRGVFLVFRE